MTEIQDQEEAIDVEDQEVDSLESLHDGGQVDGSSSSADIGKSSGPSTRLTSQRGIGRRWNFEDYGDQSDSRGNPLHKPTLSWSDDDYEDGQEAFDRPRKSRTQKTRRSTGRS